MVKIMCELNNLFIDEIVKTCLNQYTMLPKTGKPAEKEWTVLSCIVKYEKSKCGVNFEIVALGTGSKCIGATKMSSAGDILNDSHAEVFVRRGFLIYLYENIKKAVKKESSIFSFHEGLCKLNEGIEFIFYSSQMPCGDASIIPMISNFNDEQQFGEIVKYDYTSKVSGIPCKKRKLEDIHRTGAKCLPHCEQDSKESGINYHILGQIRTKPGRGDRTLSLSCSDKMSRWIHLGIQGSLLSLLCEPIYIKYFIFGANVPYSEDTLKRALLKTDSDSNYSLHLIPKFYQTRLPFLHIKTDENNRPAPGSIIWTSTDKPILQVAIQGKMLGLTKKKITSPSSSLCVSKYNLYRRFLSIVTLNPKIKEQIVGEHNAFEIPYNKMKRKSKKYLDNWMQIKANVFKSWTIKPDIWDFCVNCP